jgi:hypothetical protein
LTGHERNANPAAGPFMNFAAHAIKFRHDGSGLEGSQLPCVEKVAGFLS